VNARRLVRVSDSLPPAPRSSFDSDWRGPYMHAVRRDLNGSGLGALRLDIVRAIARAVTPGEASTAVSELAKGYTLTPEQRHSVSTLVATLMNQHMREAP
jgi:hypothetical protein